MIYEEYEFEFLGVEDENETAGDFASGTSPTSNLLAGANGELGGDSARLQEKLLGRKQPESLLHPE